jgi:hypothetical protein
MKIKELFEDADIIDFRRGVHDLKNKPGTSSDPREYRKIQDIKKRAASKAEDLAAIEDKKMQQISSKIDNSYLKKMWETYMEAALWSSTDNSTENGGDPFDQNYSVENISPETMQNMLDTCKNFMNKCGDLLDNVDADKAGFDLWLTQNRHGSGFWDREYPEKIGEKLTKIAHTFPEKNLYLGDDGYVHAE